MKERKKDEEMKNYGMKQSKGGECKERRQRRKCDNEREEMMERN
jgi:hypothetical protein